MGRGREAEPKPLCGRVRCPPRQFYINRGTAITVSFYCSRAEETPSSGLGVFLFAPAAENVPIDSELTLLGIYGIIFIES